MEVHMEIEALHSSSGRDELVLVESRIIDTTHSEPALQMTETKSTDATLLHCDFKLDNCILDPETLEVRAIVDWDMGTRGDPLFDLATMTSYWTEAQDPECMHTMVLMINTDHQPEITFQPPCKRTLR